MSITLKPEHEERIQAQIQSGRFANSEEALEAALQLLDNWNDGYNSWVQETRQKIEVAIAQIDRGEVLDGETVIAQLQEKLKKARQEKECHNS